MFYKNFLWQIERKIVMQFLSITKKPITTDIFSCKCQWKIRFCWCYVGKHRWRNFCRCLPIQCRWMQSIHPCFQVNIDISTITDVFFDFDICLKKCRSKVFRCSHQWKYLIKCVIAKTFIYIYDKCWYNFKSLADVCMKCW